MLRRDHLRPRLVKYIMAEGRPGQPSQLHLDSVDSVMMRCLLLEKPNKNGTRRQTAQSRVAGFDRLWGEVAGVPVIGLRLVWRRARRILPRSVLLKLLHAYSLLLCPFSYLWRCVTP